MNRVGKSKTHIHTSTDTNIVFSYCQPPTNTTTNHLTQLPLSCKRWQIVLPRKNLTATASRRRRQCTNMRNVYANLCRVLNELEVHKNEGGRVDTLQSLRWWCEADFCEVCCAWHSKNHNIYLSEYTNESKTRFVIVCYIMMMSCLHIIHLNNAHNPRINIIWEFSDLT